MVSIYLGGTRDGHAYVWSDLIYSSRGWLYIYANKLKMQLNVLIFLPIAVSSSLNLGILSNPHGLDIVNLEKSKYNSTQISGSYINLHGSMSAYFCPVKQNRSRERTLAKGRRRRKFSQFVSLCHRVFMPHYFKIT